MIYSYDKVYLRIAQRVLGEMLNYAVYDCGYELNEYYRLFTESSYSERFSKGDPMDKWENLCGDTKRSPS